MLDCRLYYSTEAGPGEIPIGIFLEIFYLLGRWGGTEGKADVSRPFRVSMLGHPVPLRGERRRKKKIRRERGGGKEKAAPDGGCFFFDTGKIVITRCAELPQRPSLKPCEREYVRREWSAQY